MTESIVVICMPGEGHLRRLLPIIEGLCARGRTVHVMADARARAKVECLGGRFCDLFAQYPIEAADATSIPVPSRYVSFAGVYGERLTDQVAALAPGLIIYDTFAVVAPLIARRLGVPYVNVCAGHAAEPARVIAELRRDPRVATSAECWAAVQRLKNIHGMSNASPFSYVDGQSPFLNVYCEPPAFLNEEERAAFEPIVFFGSLAPPVEEDGRAEIFPRPRRSLRIYVSFGTVIWWYFEAAARAALTVISRTFADLDVDAVISLGGHELETTARSSLVDRNVQVVDYADQWATLQEADVFVTHHGLNSTHEAIFHRVPMVSYPFFGDQPAMARRCQDLGLAVPLVASLRGAVTADDVRTALARIAAEQDSLRAHLNEAHRWEMETIAARPAVIDRIEALRHRRPGGVWYAE